MSQLPLCPHCLEPVRSGYHGSCPNCGKKVPAGSKFCPDCGSKL